MESSTLKDIIAKAIQNNAEELKMKEIDGLTTLKPEGIHDMRVAVRRVRTALKIFKKWLPKNAKKMGSELKSFSGVLGKKRDLDIFSEFTLPFVNAESIFFQKLARKKDRASKQASAILQSKNHLKLIEELENIKSDKTKKEALEVAKNRIQKTLSTVLKIASTIDSKVDDKTLHRLRICIKKLRYICEFFADLFHNQFAVFIEKSKQLQDILGDHQDAITGLTMLTRYKSVLSLDEYLKIEKNYELKKMDTRNSFFKFWKTYRYENEDQDQRLSSDRRRKGQTRKVANGCTTLLQVEAAVSTNA